MNKQIKKDIDLPTLVILDMLQEKTLLVKRLTRRLGAAHAQPVVQYELPLTAGHKPVVLWSSGAEVDPQHGPYEPGGGNWRCFSNNIYLMIVEVENATFV